MSISDKDLCLICPSKACSRHSLHGDLHRPTSCLQRRQYYENYEEKKLVSVINDALGKK